MTLGSAKMRNYSFCLDPDAKISRWVAYPLNKGLIGSGSRTDEWALDPKVPAAYQSVIYSGYKSSSTGEWFERGHQLPSADRLTSGVNQTTFYGTNMTPQRGALNERIWASLEGMVRTWSYSFDTLYVVTGADVAGATEYVLDNVGKQITVPTGYFKALLGYKKNASSSVFPSQVAGYVGIAFYFEHRDYGSSAVMSQAMTIDDLEHRLGYDFFVNLPALIGDEKAAQVESVKSSWWK